jgi:hypothetical protein
MSEGAKVDPLILQDFSQRLMRLVETIKLARRAVDNGLSNLGDSWRDREYAQFAEQLQLSNRRLDSFCAVTRDYVSSLGDDIRLLEEFQKIHAPKD